jgi:predicted enzyme related to lactoylglutathione lyase
MNLTGVLIGSEDPKPLAEYYTKLFGEPTMAEWGYTSWQIGNGWITVGPHDHVKGTNEQPGRVIWNMETDDVPSEFERFKAAGATVIQEPYHPGEGTDEGAEMWIATFADPDGNYFQLMSPM